jgi:predicted acyl esterase
VNVAHRRLVDDGYVFVFQDIRGRFKSEGTFAMARPPRASDSAGVDESTDAYDTIDWLVRHVPANNGRVGIRGVSYNGWLATMALRGPHPALRAASPQAPIGDLYRGDDFFHNGAFRLSYGYEYATLMESSRELAEVKLDGPGDAYDWYLRLGPLSTVNATRLKGRLPTWNAFAEHPNYDRFWRARAVPARSTVRRPPRTDARRRRALGPGGHARPARHVRGARARRRARRERARVGPLAPRPVVDGPRPAARRARLGERHRRVLPRLGRGAVVRHHLRAAPAPALPEALVFRSGVNRWERHAQWPPRAAGGADRPGAAGATRALYLREGGGLAFEAPSAMPNTPDSAAADRYVSDPVDPVPYRRRPIGATFGDGSRAGGRGSPRTSASSRTAATCSAGRRRRSTRT